MNDWIAPDWPAPARVRALITTRSGGSSAGPYASMNLGDHVGDDPRRVMENRVLLQQRLPEQPRWLTQVHGRRVVHADTAQPREQADAAWTRAAGVVCAVLTADCLPVLLCDESGSAVGVAHAGWRGLAAGVVEALVGAMAPPHDALMAYLGPAIGPRAFEVGADVREAFVAREEAAANAFTAHGEDKWLADIYELARMRLRGVGVERIFGGAFCTASEAQRFYSYRRDKVTGRIAALIWLQD